MCGRNALVSDDTDGGYGRTPDGIFTAPLRMFYPYERTLGPTYSRFLAGVAVGRLEGTRSPDGTVYVPPAEFDPRTGAPLDDWVELASEGEVVSWSWQAEPTANHPLDRAFAWALVRPDGATTSMLAAVDAGDPAAMRTGMRVRARLAADAEPSMGIRAIECFEPVEADGSGDRA